MPFVKQLTGGFALHTHLPVIWPGTTEKKKQTKALFALLFQPPDVQKQCWSLAAATRWLRGNLGEIGAFWWWWGLLEEKHPIRCSWPSMDDLGSAGGELPPITKSKAWFESALLQPPPEASPPCWT